MVQRPPLVIAPPRARALQGLRDTAGRRGSLELARRPGGFGNCFHPRSYSRLHHSVPPAHADIIHWGPFGVVEAPGEDDHLQVCLGANGLLA